MADDFQSQLRALWLSSGLSQDEFVAHARMASVSFPARLKKCYHGTSAENAMKIREEGFLPWTYFGQHLEDAIGFGGDHVFEVMFPADTWAEADWQFRARDLVPPDRIVRHHVYTRKLLYEDEMLGQRIFASNMSPEELTVRSKTCGQCQRSLEGMPWEKVWRRNHGLVELCSKECAYAWERANDPS